MPQFTVHKNRNTATALKGVAFTVLTPHVEVEGRACVVMTPQLAGISRKELGEAVTELTAQRDTIMAALDFLVMGI